MSDTIKTKCLECGKLFNKDKRKNTKTCSDACRIKRWKSQITRAGRERHKRLETIPCVVCGALFQQKTGVHKICDKTQCKSEMQRRAIARQTERREAAKAAKLRLKQKAQELDYI